MTVITESGGGYIDTDLSADLAAAALNLARRFHDGATLWVISPQWEPHAHHVAVEFVHPVIMGKRALPSVALVDPDPVAQARVATQPGDLLLAVASADEPAVKDAMRRAPAWGALTLWIGAGPRPPAGAANHILWVDSDDPMVPATGRFVLMYHLLWELTHVCFEHPGLLKSGGRGMHRRRLCHVQRRRSARRSDPRTPRSVGSGPRPHRERRGVRRRQRDRRGRAGRSGAGARGNGDRAIRRLRAGDEPMSAHVANGPKAQRAPAFCIRSSSRRKPTPPASWTTSPHPQGARPPKVLNCKRNRWSSTTRC